MKRRRSPKAFRKRPERRGVETSEGDSKPPIVIDLHAGWGRLAPDTVESGEDERDEGTLARYNGLSVEVTYATGNYG